MDETWYKKLQLVFAVEGDSDYRLHYSTGFGVKMKGSQSNARAVTESNASGGFVGCSQSSVLTFFLGYSQCFNFRFLLASVYLCPQTCVGK